MNSIQEDVGMKVLVINCGSSSLKYQLIDMENESVIAKGLCERIGIEGSVLTHKPAGKATTLLNLPCPPIRKRSNSLWVL